MHACNGCNTGVGELPDKYLCTSLKAIADIICISQCKGWFTGKGHAWCSHIETRGSIVNPVAACTSGTVARPTGTIVALNVK